MWRGTMSDRAVHSRRDLPHWYVPGAAHFVTYRLAGTLPASTLEDFAEKRSKLLRSTLATGMTEQSRRASVHKQLFADYDRYLDGNHSIDWLSRPAVAAMVRQNLYHHNGSKYHLLAYCIMPNHVHVVLQPITGTGGSPTFDPGADEPCGETFDGHSLLSSIMHSLK